MLNYNNDTLSWLETPNNAFAIKILDHNEQILQKTTINTNIYHIEARLTNGTTPIKIIAVTPIDEFGNETEFNYLYYFYFNDSENIQNTNVLNHKCLNIQLNALGQAMIGFSLTYTQSIIITISAYPNKVIENYIVTLSDPNGFIIPPKYIYTPKGYPGYINPPPLEVLLTQGNYTVWVNGKYL